MCLQENFLHTNTAVLVHNQHEQKLCRLCRIHAC
jgi:hypothetical protein